MIRSGRCDRDQGSSQRVLGSGQDLTCDLPRLRVAAVSIKREGSKTWHLIHKGVAFPLCIHKLDLYPTRLVVIHVSNDIDGKVCCHDMLDPCLIVYSGGGSVMIERRNCKTSSMVKPSSAGTSS